jgi:hypothetical protein
MAGDSPYGSISCLINGEKKSLQQESGISKISVNLESKAGM